MLFTLLGKECKAILKSTTYYIVVACLILFVMSQFGGVSAFTKPSPGQADYGTKESDDPEVIMKSSIIKLQGEYVNNQYGTYPIGFYKQVKLNEKKKNKVFEIIDHILAADEKTLKESYSNLEGGEVYTSSFTGEMVSTGAYHYYELEENPVFFTISDDLTFEEYQNYMNQIDGLLGGGSSYKASRLAENTEVPITYEEALKEYESIIYDDKVSRAYARVFADYVGIILAILPVFLAVTRAVRDRRSKGMEVIYSKNISSTKIILSRYIATVIMVLIPVIILSINPCFQSTYYASMEGVSGDYLAFLRIILGWLLPTVLFTVSVGFLFGELTGGPAAILIQTITWAIALFSNLSNLTGGFGWNLIPRFNGLGYYEVYRQNFMMLVRNRMFYACIGILLLLITILVYDSKRKGVLKAHGALLHNRKK